MKYITKMK